MAIVNHTLPVPAFLENTARFTAGSVTFGVEYRVLDEAMIFDYYGPDARAKFPNGAPAGMGAVINEDGLSLHVFGTADGHEYLRFDCFDDAPHYHYLDPAASRNVVHDYDAIAHGPIVDWALDTLRTRLGPMLTHAGATELAESLDPAAVAEVIPAVAAEARRMLAIGHPVAVG
ncbi:MAG: hypothetical protein ABI658_14050 [Acidimicrobiales bacterium]